MEIRLLTGVDPGNSSALYKIPLIKSTEAYEYLTNGSITSGQNVIEDGDWSFAGQGLNDIIRFAEIPYSIPFGTVNDSDLVSSGVITNVSRFFKIEPVECPYYYTEPYIWRYFRVPNSIVSIGISGSYVKINEERFRAPIPTVKTVDGDTTIPGSPSFTIGCFDTSWNYQDYISTTWAVMDDEERHLKYFTINGRVPSASGYRGNLRINYYTTGFNLDYFLLLWNLATPYHIPGPTPGEDPYTPGGTTDEGGGYGDFDNVSEDVDIPGVPNLTVDSTGFISLYSPTITNLRSLASYLWSDTGLNLETFKRIFADPISAILGLSIVPVTPTMGSSAEVIIGNVRTGVTMPRVASQYVRFDCGTIGVNEYWGGYLDYSPYTTAEIYLPYIGTKALNIDDIMGKSVHLVYNIDLLSGACCALIECGDSVLYQFIGQCSCSVPITGQDMTRMINGILSIVGAGAGTFVASGGNAVQTAGSVVGALASSVMGAKQRVEKSGSMGSMGGMLGVRNPYLIITRPRQALPAQQSKFTGYPSYITGSIGSFTGYTEFASVHLAGVPATEAEKQEIEALLKAGVIL